MTKLKSLFVALTLATPVAATGIPECNEEHFGDRMAVPDRDLVQGLLDTGMSQEEVATADGSVQLMLCTLVPNQQWLSETTVDNSLTMTSLQDNAQYQWVLL